MPEAGLGQYVTVLPNVTTKPQPRASTTPPCRSTPPVSPERQMRGRTVGPAIATSLLQFKNLGYGLTHFAEFIGGKSLDSRPQPVLRHGSNLVDDGDG